MRIFARIANGFVAQLVKLPSGLVPSDVYVPNLAATLVDVTDAAAPPRIGWRRLDTGSFAPPAVLQTGLSPDEIKKRARDLLYSSDPIIEHFYEHLLSVPDAWAEYRFALRRIVLSGALPSGRPPVQPALPIFSFTRDAVEAARQIPAEVFLPPATRRLLAAGRVRQ